MNSYPLSIEFLGPAPQSASQVAIRLAVVLVLSIVGLSVGSAFLLLFFCLPLLSTLVRITRGNQEYLKEFVPLFEKGAVWGLAALGWVGLVHENWPSSHPERLVSLKLSPSSNASGVHTWLRVFTGLPNLLVFSVVSFFVGILWIAGMVLVATTGALPISLRRAFAGTLRWGTRLLAFQAGLADVYPPFSFDNQALLPSESELS